MPRRPLTDVEWRRSLQRRRMLDAERKRRLRENNAYRVLERARNREARRRQRENPKFREAERARAHAYYMSLSSTATDEGIICRSCGLILKHVKALRTHRAEFHPRQRISLDNIFKYPRNVSGVNDDNVVDCSKLEKISMEREDLNRNDNKRVFVENQMNDSTGNVQSFDPMEPSLVDFYGIIFSDVEAAVDRMLSCKLNKQRSYDLQTHLAIKAKLGELREYVLETEKTVERLAAYGAASSGFIQESAPSDLISVLRNFIFHGIPSVPDDLLPESDKINEKKKISGTSVDNAEKSSIPFGSKHELVLVNSGEQCIQETACY
uniref:C2H2-type domain-containing protein n=1 Tax=Setaria digitata TaxID=48799 RepID=A0A915PLI7_9BILA